MMLARHETSKEPMWLAKCAQVEKLADHVNGCEVSLSAIERVTDRKHCLPRGQDKRRTD